MCVCIYSSCLLSPMSRWWSLANLAGAGDCPHGARPPRHRRSPATSHGPRGSAAPDDRSTAEGRGDRRSTDLPVHRRFGNTDQSHRSWLQNSRCRCICKSHNQEGVAIIRCCEGIGDSEENLRKQIGAALRWHPQMCSRRIHPRGRNTFHLIIHDASTG